MARPRKNKEEQVVGEPIEDQKALEVEIVPSIEVVGGKKHALIGMFDGDHANLPVLKSVGCGRVPGTNTYLAYTIHSKGSNIIKIEVEEPNIRPIAEESAKIFFVNTFMNGDENVPG